MNPSAEPTSSPTNPASDTHASRQAAPVMDVVPPPSSEQPPTAVSPELAAQLAPEPVEPEPVEHAAPETSLEEPQPSEAKEPEPSADSPDDIIEKEAKHNKQPALATPQVPKSKGNGVALAIVATVIIVLGLSALAVFAYTSTQ